MKKFRISLFHEETLLNHEGTELIKPDVVFDIWSYPGYDKMVVDIVNQSPDFRKKNPHFNPKGLGAGLDRWLTEKLIVTDCDVKFWEDGEETRFERL